MTHEVYKILVLGEEGKSLVSHLTSTPIDHEDTVCVTAFIVNEKIALNIFHNCNDNVHWIDASVALVLFSLVDDTCKQIVTKIGKIASSLGDDFPIIIVATKNDSPFQTVDKGIIARMLFTLRRKHKNVRYIETSLKSGQNFDKLLRLLCEYI